jgi:hypothetical protein
MDPLEIFTVNPYHGTLVLTCFLGIPMGYIGTQTLLSTSFLLHLGPFTSFNTDGLQIAKLSGPAILGT